MYEKTATPRDGLRLHLNENTGGCSPAVIQALRTITCADVSFYPDYAPAVSACARYLDVDQEQLLLTNGLDEGILAASILALRGAAAVDPFEAIVVVPAFDMYAASADAVGGRVVEVPLGDEFSFPLETLLAAITRRTRIIFITDPNNPTGQSVPAGAIEAVAAAAPEALVFVDEAYIEFRGDPRIDHASLARTPNLVIGRTFAKAHGLAAIRIGALVAAPPVVDALRRVVPPYSINVVAAHALPAALSDRTFLDGYVQQVRESREILYEALDRRGTRYWRSDANFVLVRLGDRSAAIVDALRARGIHVRDRSNAQGCGGCIRITTGLVEHTREAIAALEEVL